MCQDWLSNYVMSQIILEAPPLGILKLTLSAMKVKTASVWLSHSPHFLAVFGDLGHIQDAALFRRLGREHIFHLQIRSIARQERKAAVKHHHQLAPRPQHAQLSAPNIIIPNQERQVLKK